MGIISLKRVKGVILPGLLLLLSTSFQASQAQSTASPPLDEDVAEDVDTDADVDPEPEEVRNRVTITDPFIELHTGPGAAFPVYYVVDRGAEVTILRRKTNWFRIETSDGQSGWASRDQMSQTLLPSGEQFQLVEADQDAFSGRRWVLGITGGEFESAPVFTVFTGYSFTENLAAEAHFGQSIGNVSSSAFYKANMVMQPIPDYRYSPYMTLGLGRIEISPSTSLIVADNETNTFAQFGLGIQRYVSRSFLLRFEANEYIVFSTSSTRNSSEDVSEWKFGFAVFF